MYKTMGEEEKRKSLLLLLLLEAAFSIKGEEVLQVTALSGGMAELPCDANDSGPDATDPTTPSVLLVVWYKDDDPIYSWDARKSVTSVGALTSASASQWATFSVKGRSNWLFRPPRLTLRPVNRRDAGIYRCRTDFRYSPSKKTTTQLTVIEPPTSLKIFDDKSREIIGRAGPYKEGETPVFVCVVTGGHPSPTVRWFKEDESLSRDQVLTTAPAKQYYDLDIARRGSDSAFEEIQSLHHRDVRQKTRREMREYEVTPERTRHALKSIGIPLTLPALRRSDLLSTFSCRANNSKLISPTTASIVIDMQLPPISVEVESREALRAGHRELVTCLAKGARPPGTISWLLQGALLPHKSYHQEESDSEDISTSVLEIVVGREHRGQQLTCRVVHSLLPPSAPLHSILTLDVLLPPDVSLRLGRDLTFESIKEGDSIYLECAVLAHPPPYKISWEHNGRTIAHEPVAGVEVEWGRLTLPRVQRSDSGTYNCIASNVEGDTRSNTLPLQVLFAPVCRNNKEYSRSMVSKGSRETELLCEVDANPPPNNFTWALNTSMGLVYIPNDQYAWSNMGSAMKYTPGKHDAKKVGEALCWASNKIGRQLMPCLLPLRSPKPSPLLHCALHNLTSSEFHLFCDPGDDKGIPQTYELTVQKSLDGMYLANLSTFQPTFRVGGLPGGIELKLMLFTVNSYGQSEPVELFIIMPHASNTYKGSYNTFQKILLFGITAVAMLLLFFIIIFFKYKDTFKQVSTDTKSRQAVTGLREDECSNVVHEERNPDVVPLNKEQNGIAQMRAEEEWEVAARSPRLQEQGSAVSTQSLIPETIGTWSIRSLHGHEIVTSRTPLPATQESCV